MAKKAGPLDSLFDLADDVLDKMGADPAHPPKPASQKQVIDVQSTDLVRNWEQTWEHETWWAPVVANPKDMSGVWHAFKEGELKGIGCGTTFRSDLIHERRKLQPGKVIMACTSCIVAVARHG